MGIFGNLFDFNGDGKTDIFEEMMELDFIEKEERRRKREECKHYGYDCDGDCDNCDGEDYECDDCDCDEEDDDDYDEDDDYDDDDYDDDDF